MADLTEADVTRTLWAARDLLRASRVQYMLIGALALSAWGRPRATLDLDFQVLTDADGLERLQRAAPAWGFAVDESWMEWNPLLRGSQIRLVADRVPVDLLLPRDDQDREALGRRRKKRLGTKIFWVASAEDLILQKLKVGRPRDFEDASTVIARQGGRIDMEYLQRWARRLGIRQELDYILTL